MNEDVHVGMTPLAEWGQSRGKLRCAGGFGLEPLLDPDDWLIMWNLFAFKE